MNTPAEFFERLFALTVFTLTNPVYVHKIEKAKQLRDIVHCKFKLDKFQALRYRTDNGARVVIADIGKAGLVLFYQEVIGDGVTVRCSCSDDYRLNPDKGKADVAALARFYTYTLSGDGFSILGDMADRPVTVDPLSFNK